MGKSKWEYMEQTEMQQIRKNWGRRTRQIGRREECQGWADGAAQQSIFPNRALLLCSVLHAHVICT